ncbi:C2H2 and C2HC zinc finger [Glarea lozoyensis ATCC 20868]|uniref:C2H2 and C2HC zinc finger n=1 Tax=Glarea lozoyensis (strain ATCC 20868 / MF5171) TaxID=1116229 RepID=S3DVW7_GLAL2|nr:C2H2 and C2HC zinc finger [Glarea lozoyensis ATCC 20868]EPE36101.1 C2H2 and C2HC zinc finger [Glarea lozoyensis ATCC 20868]
MTTVENGQLQDPAPRDDYDPDDVGFSNSPPLQPVKVNLQPTATHSFMGPLPPPLSPRSSPASPDRKTFKKPKAIPSQSDAGLVSMMANGAAPEISEMAGKITLADADMDEDELSSKAVLVDVNMEDEDESEDEGEEEGSLVEVAVHGEQNSSGKVDMARAVQALAAQAVEAMRNIPKGRSPSPKIVSAGSERPHSQVSRESHASGGEVRPKISSIFGTANPPRSPLEITVRLEPKSPGSEELPPIRQGPDSPMANGHGNPITLPSISASLAKIGDVVPNFTHSPPGHGRPPPMFSPIQGHGSPPKSPTDTFRHQLPSPGRPYYPYNGHRRPSNSEGIQYSSANDYSSSNTETPSTEASAATPAIDRMSIDGITNPQIGGFQCTYPGCNAQPFQTQYLLNSHANVHSSNRPHYCSVKGCPRSEGGKGFKRKNEMIRHGLVHDSPGYVCPFCPDREHKYPRPDNLQRQVH